MPIDNSKAARFATENSPSLTRGRNSFTYYQGMKRIPEGAAPEIKNKSWAIMADLDLKDANANGMIVTQGGLNGGYGTIHGKGAGGAFDEKETGAMDPGVVMSIGLVNAPAMTLLELSQFKKKFQLWGVFGFTAPLGTYDANELINTGINKWNFRTGMSMSYKFGKDPNKANIIDFTPSVNMFTDNNDPFMGNKATQKALFVGEAHFSHFFNPKFYMSFDYRMQEGGRTFVDGVDQNNRISQYTLGTTVQ